MEGVRIPSLKGAEVLSPFVNGFMRLLNQGAMGCTLEYELLSI